MKVIANDFEVKVFNYYCSECEEIFYLERLVQPNIVNCPHCGEGEYVCIVSRHLSELFSFED